MDPRELLLDVWREACRHIHIEASAGRIAERLSASLPLAGLAVLLLDRESGTLEPRAEGPEARTPTSGPPGSRASAASGPSDGPASPRRPRSDRRRGPLRLPPDEAEALRRWSRDGRVTGREDKGIASLLDRLSSSTGRGPGDWLAVPLAPGAEGAGLLLLQAHPDRTFTGADRQLAALLVEPFSVALENDARVHELAALREAAEADRRSVLQRIGRDDLLETIIGEDGGLRPVMKRVELVAPSDVPVLILGETGSGKEVIARAIHERSARARGPFLRVNCGAIPGELVDSELFGHERGAFTGATASRRGWFERADRGTLLLDEIGELPLPAQVRLLRVLQEGTFERVGGERALRVDVRIVAATHRDLPGMVQRGRFREDLWYRITGFPILLPPLSERREDIPELARHFVERAARRFGLRPLALSDEDLSLLLAYEWPGNIRELATVIDRAAILGAGESLEVARALGGGFQSSPLAGGTPGEAAPSGGIAGEPDAASGVRSPDPGRGPRGGRIETLDEAMRRHIEQALVRTRGQIEGSRGAARLLDLNPHTLRSRMRKLGIDWARYREGPARDRPPAPSDPEAARDQAFTAPHSGPRKEGG